MKHVKNSAVSAEELEKRAGTGKNGIRERTFLAVFDDLRARYEETLAKEKTIDFEDMIGMAAEYIKGGTFKHTFRYVLVDEFQDISAGRMALIAALRRPGLAYFLVGDDWQSIYRFAGSDVSLVRRCGEYLGHVQERQLTRTFRYGKGILEPTSAFIQRNKDQTQRRLHSASEEEGRGITVVACASQSEGIVTALNDIVAPNIGGECMDGRARGIGSTAGDALSTLLLGRYRHSRDGIPDRRRASWPRWEFSTVHSAKGREAAYAVVLDLKDDRMGFPSQVEDDPLLELVLPPSARGEVNYAEERRLFYVAATRAKCGTYLIADRANPSLFVRELREEYRSTRQLGVFVGDNSPVCPRCDGFLVTSKTEKTMRCTNYPLCEHISPRCDRCGEGYVVRYSGDAGRVTCTGCSNPLGPCPRCELGVLVEKCGQYGKFFGCSEYWSEPPCEYTKNIETPQNDASWLD